MQRFLESKNANLFLFALVTILAYGFFVPFTGFYWDDWVFVWIAKFLGPLEFLPAFIHIRPFLIPIFIATTSLIPPVPVYWQLFALIIRFLAAYSLWFAMSRVWPHLKFQTLAASLMFLVFPAYSQHWAAYTHINQEWIALILYLCSFGFTATALRQPSRFAGYTALALLFHFQGLFATEYFFGMEPLRFFFIQVVIAEKIKDRKDSFIKAVRLWLPYLIIWVGNAIWLRFYYSLGYNAYQLEVLQNPASNFSIISAIGEVIWKVGLYSWVQILPLTATNITAPSNLLAWALAILTFSLLLPMLKKIHPAHTIPIANRRFAFIFIGLIGLILGRMPSYAAGLPLRLQSSFDRFTISMMLGGCLMMVGLVEWLFRKTRAKIYACVFLIALGVSQQFYNGNLFRRDWETQQDLFWQLKWRIPSLEPGTLILTDEIPIDYESDLSLAGPLNWIYAPHYKDGDLPYMLFYVKSRLGGSLPTLEPDTPIEIDLRQRTFRGNTSQVIVIYKPNNGCLRVLDPMMGDTETYRKKLPQLMEAIALSDTSLIHAAEMTTPEFLKTPDKTWCYYYTKAELARQFGEWDQVQALGEAAERAGYRPSDPFEWLPFIEALAKAADYTRAIQLSDAAIREDIQVRAGICQVWKRIAAASEENSQAIDISQALHQFECLP